jgi:16S rRNA (guanine527-N7)-methyltransferase
MTKEEFIINCKNLSIEITEEIYSKLYKYFELLVEWNNKFNMTSILEEKEVFLLHFYDSLCLNKINLNEINSLCDFGTGAGFPGMVIALVYPNIEVTLVESNNKKCTFLEEVKQQLNIKNVSIFNERIEDFARKNREKYDIVTCRAVTSIPIIIELSTSLIKVNGLLAPLKSNCEEEINKYKYLEKEFNLKLENLIKYNLPINDAYRVIPIYKKLKETDIKYPRNYGTIVKKYK